MKTAEYLFVTQGFDSTSIREIATEGSFNSATIYYYFSTKEEMFEEIIREKSAIMEKAIMRLLSNYSDPMERLIKLTDFYCEDLFRHQNYYLLIMQVLSLPAKYGKIRDYVFERRNRIHDLISTIVQNGQEKEIFRQDVNPLIMAFILFGTVNSSVVNSEHYRTVNGMTDWPQTKFTKHLIETVGQQVKKIVLEMVRLP